MTRRTALAWGAGALVIGLLTAFSPHLWAGGWPELDAQVAAFELWTAVPFALLAGLLAGRVLSPAAAILGVAASVAATVLVQSAVDDDPQGALGLLFLPVLLIFAILVLWGADALVRRSLRKP